MQPQEAATALPVSMAVVCDKQIADLQSSPVMRALSAGWTTPQDEAYLFSILAWTHSALLAGPGLTAMRREGENSLAYCVFQPIVDGVSG